MACSCSSTSFTSFTGASPSSPSSSAAASASSSTSASFSFHSLQHQLPSLSSTNKHALLRWDTEEGSKKSLHVGVISRQGNYDKSRKNTSERGDGGGHYSSIAMKEDKAGRKGGSSGGRNPKPYNNNNNNTNPRSYNSSSNPRSQNNSSSIRRGNRLAVVDEEEDEEDSEDEGSIRNSRSYNQASNSNVNTIPSSARRGSSRLSVVNDKEEDGGSEDDFESDEEDDDAVGGDASLESLIMPIPPAGFVLAGDGSVSLMAPPHKRITTLVDAETDLPLDCLIRRVFSSSDGRQCFLLCPLDTALQILRIEDGDVLKEISDEELEDIFPTASYELAKQRLHLVRSGFCLTLRGGFYYTEEDVMDLNTAYGESSDTSLSEGVEIANFVVNGSEYLIYTPLDPLMFVAYKDGKTGQLLIAEDDLLDDNAVLDAIDEEKEFQAYMEDDVMETIDDDDDDEEED